MAPSSSARASTKPGTAHILNRALRFAGNCAAAYTAATHTTRRALNTAVFTRISVRDGHVHSWGFQPPFDGLLGATRFEYASWVDRTASYSNLPDLRKRLAQLVPALESRI